MLSPVLLGAQDTGMKESWPSTQELLSKEERWTRPQVMTSHEPGEPRGAQGLGGDEQGVGGELLRAGQRWLCRGADVSLEAWVITGKEKCGDMGERRDEGSITLMLETLHGRRVPSKY